MTTHTTVQPTTPVPLEDDLALEPLVVGAKAATLARLSRLGHRVPPAVVVPVGARIPTRDDLVQAARHLGAPVAVRSSAVDEDGEDASFAGQYRTVLGVDPADGEALRQAVVSVIESVDSAHARSSMAGQATGAAGMAVLVQRQVDARAAGVAFSADPVTGDDVVVISAVAGLGDRLVSGEVTPEDWRGSGGGEVRCEGTPAVLHTADAERIAGLVERVATDLGVPVDVEWALSPDGELALLQARPITALPRRPVIELPTEGTWEKDTSHLSEPLTPIAETMWVPPLEAAFRDMTDTFGLLIDGMEFRCVGGELYSRAIPPGGKDGPAPPWWLIAVVARVHPVFRRKSKAARHAVDTGVPASTIERWEAEWKPELAGRIASLRAVDLTTLDDDGLLAHLDALSELFADAHRIHFMLFLPYLMAVRPFVEDVSDTLGWTTSEALTLLDGLSDSSSAPTRDLQAVAAAARAHPGARSILGSWAGEPLDDVLRSLADTGADAAASAIASHFERFGCRVTAFDPGRPTIDERPGIVLGVLRDLVVSGPEPDDLAESLARRRSEAEAAMDEAVEAAGLPPADRERLRRLRDEARRVWPVREDNLTYTDALPAGLVRRAMLEVGRRLVAGRVVTRADDACWLELDEVRRLLAGSSLDGAEAPAQRVARRRAERSWVQAHPGPVTLGPPPEDPPDLRGMPDAVRQTTGAVLWAIRQEFSHAQDQGHDGISGIPASPGRYTGPVRIVRSDREFGAIQPGDVLVCPITTPAWSLNFGRIGALVTDAGGALSHAAIVAREHGIPAVVATGTATADLHDGEVVVVDGSTGTVTPVDRSDGTQGVDRG